MGRFGCLGRTIQVFDTSRRTELDAGSNAAAAALHALVHFALADHFPIFRKQDEIRLVLFRVPQVILMFTAGVLLDTFYAFDGAALVSTALCLAPVTMACICVMGMMA